MKNDRLIYIRAANLVVVCENLRDLGDKRGAHWDTLSVQFA